MGLELARLDVTATVPISSFSCDDTLVFEHENLK